MKLPGVILMFLIFTLASAPAGAQDLVKTIRFAVDPNWPPLEFVDSSGKIVGYAADYFTAVCRVAGYSPVFLKVEWDVIFDGLESGEYEAVMASVTITPERRKKMDFTIPYYIVRQSLLVPSTSTIDNIRQLGGLKTGTQAETTATEIVEKIPGSASVTYPSIEDAVKALAAGDLDAVVCEDVVAANFLKQPEFATKIKISTTIETPGAEELYAVAVRKNNLAILVALNDGIKAVKAKGLETQLRQKWF